MPISQNARFFGEAAPDAEFEHPRGASIVRIIKDSLVQRGWEVSEIDNWRDGGWSVTCCRATSKLQLVVAPMATGSEWFLQIAPSYVPGLVGRLLGKSASAPPETILALAQDAFSALSHSGRFRGFLWCWDGYPEEHTATPQPAAAQDCSA